MPRKGIEYSYYSLNRLSKEKLIEIVKELKSRERRIKILGRQLYDISSSNIIHNER